MARRKSFSRRRNLLRDSFFQRTLDSGIKNLEKFCKVNYNDFNKNAPRMKRGGCYDKRLLLNCMYIDGEKLSRLPGSLGGYFCAYRKDKRCDRADAKNEFHSYTKNF